MAQRPISRRDGRWSEHFAACIDCNGTERPHVSHGRCNRCHQKFKRRTDPAWRDRVNQLKKESLIKSGWAERYDSTRQADPKRRAQRKEIGRRWSQKNSPWPVGALVLYEWIPGLPPIKGEIVAKPQRKRADVKFATFTESIPVNRLQVLERRAA